MRAEGLDRAKKHRPVARAEHERDCKAKKRQPHALPPRFQKAHRQNRSQSTKNCRRCPCTASKKPNARGASNHKAGREPAQPPHCLSPAGELPYFLRIAATSPLTALRFCKTGRGYGFMLEKSDFTLFFILIFKARNGKKITARTHKPAVTSFRNHWGSTRLSAAPSWYLVYLFSQKCQVRPPTWKWTCIFRQIMVLSEWCYR